ncbi:energy-coupling factor transporter transmembrane component T [Bacillus swezeyi]|uniref:Energy-coupling factor transporter transmembrane protein EcfT n=1 Tax=Bacillus swezeyi TaxID=1925020 RepID=A0A5M8RPL7_9BACI|nr:energy-coupling factor transporter transmembrane component T [Bacillus swezeyi]KAA6449340.1 energy-coupling factor transporter transmembrane protein EcfT [Bacillus swezeyi]KAA6474106.1 energy-coupling factor transporter transmembrane protein EcfT [Bacillus swezeyi]TYS33357.1 energy-coupling factor transporter transmembrane protein EcfT [Bacillus swezeyi]
MFDVRLQFLMLLACSGAILFTSIKETIFLAGIALAFLGCQQLWKPLFYWLLIYTILLIAYILTDQYLTISFLRYISMILFIILRISPTLMIASSLTKVPPGKLLAGLQKIKIPDSLLLTLTVALRFFPVLKAEAKIINENAAIRGISGKQMHNWLHATRLFEYTIVPLLMRTIKLADELSSSAATRGIDAPFQKTTIYTIRFSVFDSIGFTLFAIILLTPFI